MYYNKQNMIDFITVKDVKLKLESSIRDKVKSKGLSPAKRPPQKIKVTYNKE